jgi:predicted anti-sigma-YlaC factor YlaD
MSLLGPSGPEVSCEECFEHLDEYVEGRDVPGMAAHLEGCPACREDYESLVALVRQERDSAPTEHD